METKKTYAEKLKDPRWQRLRLEVMNRDNFTCLKCGSTKKTLNVHHFFYQRKCEPWEYEIGHLATLCEGCHKDETECHSDNTLILQKVLARKKFFASEILELAEYIHYIGTSSEQILGKLKDLFSKQDNNINYGENTDGEAATLE